MLVNMCQYIHVQLPRVKHVSHACAKKKCIFRYYYHRFLILNKVYFRNSQVLETCSLTVSTNRKSPDVFASQTREWNEC